MCSTVQEQITTCGQNAIVKIGERTNIRPQKNDLKWAQMEDSLIIWTIAKLTPPKLVYFKENLLCY